MTEKKIKLKSLIGFLSANKIDNYNRVGGGGGGEGEEKEKKSKRIYRTSQKIRIINVFLESLSRAVSPFPRWESQSILPP